MLIGAGAPTSIRITPGTNEPSSDGEPLIPDTAGLTSHVLASLRNGYGQVIEGLLNDLGDNPNIEQILSRTRVLADALGDNIVHGIDGPGYNELSEEICSCIGESVKVPLPNFSNPYIDLATWIGGTVRDHPIEIFTPNYDLLMEQALERTHTPFFDGFSGSKEPFFDAVTIVNADLPPRWARLWKLHGSLGWDITPDGDIVRGKGDTATQLIYPTHLKYRQTQKLPYTALIERLRKFLLEPDSLLITCGFSFSDVHLYNVIDESLSYNRASAAIAFRFGSLEDESSASNLALHRSNMSVYASNGAIINCIQAPWQPSDSPTPSWKPIRSIFWGTRKADQDPLFLLGDFSAFVKYIVLTRAEYKPEKSSNTIESYNDH